MPHKSMDIVFYYNDYFFQIEIQIVHNSGDILRFWIYAIFLIKRLFKNTSNPMDYLFSERKLEQIILIKFSLDKIR